MTTDVSHGQLVWALPYSRPATRLNEAPAISSVTLETQGKLA